MTDLSRKRTWVSNPGLGWGWWRGFVMLECPNGHRVRMNIDPGGHSVATDGTVSPSCVCPGESSPCTFHEFVKLLEWGPAMNEEEAED